MDNQATNERPLEAVVDNTIHTTPTAQEDVINNTSPAQT